MTVKEIHSTSIKGNEFIVASCARCFRKGKMIFHLRIDNPSDVQREAVRYKAMRHDRTGTHPVTIMSNYRTR